MLYEYLQKLTRRLTFLLLLKLWFWLSRTLLSGPYLYEVSEVSSITYFEQICWKYKKYKKKLEMVKKNRLEYKYTDGLLKMDV